MSATRTATASAIISGGSAISGPSSTTTRTGASNTTCAGSWKISTKAAASANPQPDGSAGGARPLFPRLRRLPRLKPLQVVGGGAGAGGVGVDLGDQLPVGPRAIRVAVRRPQVAA